MEFPILHASYRKFCFYISCINPWKVRYLICHMLETYVYTYHLPCTYPFYFSPKEMWYNPVSILIHLAYELSSTYPYYSLPKEIWYNPVSILICLAYELSSTPVLTTPYPRKCGTTLYQFLFAWHTSCPVPVLTTPYPRKCYMTLYKCLFTWHTTCSVPVLAILGKYGMI